MMTSTYEELKNIFIDSVDKSAYVELESAVYNYSVLESSLDKPLKMVLLYGKPGTGKSMLLNKLYHNLKENREIHYFDAPILSEKEFLKSIYEAMSGQAIPEKMRVNFDALLKYCQKLRDKRELVFLLDECQLYSEPLMEKIRLLSDTRVVKFVITLHKTENEDVIAKEHFKTRIWEIIEMSNANEYDLELYIQKKMIKKGFIDVSNNIKKRDIKYIHAQTKGNFRETNKYLYTVFDIYEYYERNEPEKIADKKFSKKILEMAAIRLGYIDE
ncbi:MAG: MSHA biogenesis protein MshM [uncultured Sulfurovum sp.]|uniref:MSHA biogenesis protein MshM n=1 Tax=uncultured Sulfurovum sp. TaxID=269237 RepID=A0A6S6SP66_9BACT|nr:MAG: MSHA biogenesis protein MshM [uncultured Sulfurovum sp.]